MLESKPALLNEYNKTFNDQLEKAGTIMFHLENYVQNKKLAKEIQKNIYVDNLVLSAETPEEAYSKATQARQIFQDMEMNLREFLCNSTVVQTQFPLGVAATKTTQKILGITWSAKDDVLSISCEFEISSNVTKRIVAQKIASIYDPLGWLVPLLIRAKMFQQKLWVDGYDWDETLPTEVMQQWEGIMNDIHGFRHSFPRLLLNSPNQYHLAVFADSSAKAMADLKRDRVEVLFGYIATNENPADAGTRGLSKNEIDHHFWWTGPEILRQPVSQWENSMFSITKEDEDDTACENVFVNSLIVHDIEEDLLDLQRYSTYRKAIRVLVYVLRFITNLINSLSSHTKTKLIKDLPELSKISPKSNIILGAETQTARVILLKNHQKAFLTPEYRKSMEHTLRLFLDSEGLWRTKGRLGNALNYDANNPIFVVPHTELSGKIIGEAHDNTTGSPNSDSKFENLCIVVCNADDSMDYPMPTQIQQTCQKDE
ncbi:hypothetical protein OESDEN_21189 [Oesophagostomum dentatum]|uniref:Pao retrotransposon peptidase n=1 Tax=Oesophagostomum dentatum TaxID=61180 RepID=A0A0B1S5N3_OESDE|nr:hypothetical protein OESDEN_21189 [Oesophagostomum dentatum]